MDNIQVNEAEGGKEKTIDNRKPKPDLPSHIAGTAVLKKDGQASDRVELTPTAGLSP